MGPFLPSALCGPVLIIRRRSPWTIKAASAANENNLLFWAQKRSRLLWSLARLLTHYLVFGVTFVPIKKIQQASASSCLHVQIPALSAAPRATSSRQAVISSPLLKHWTVLQKIIFFKPKISNITGFFVQSFSFVKIF
jgi:hypothetical protein